MDNNEGFVAPAVAYCQAELHEEFTIAISALDDTKDSFKSLTKLVPEGSEIHQALVLINMQIKTAHSLSKSANIAMGTADVTAGRSKFLAFLWLLVNNFLRLERKGKSVQLKVFQQYMEILKRMKILLHKKKILKEVGFEIAIESGVSSCKNMCPDKVFQYQIFESG